LVSVDLEFSPQPWIYLEASAAESIVARYGDSRASSPRYDLEAMRQYIGRTAMKEARWGESRDLQTNASAADASVQPTTGGLIDPKPFRYSRTIPDSPPGLAALLLDAAVLAHSRSDLGDLRIVDANNRQIPYLLEK